MKLIFNLWVILSFFAIETSAQAESDPKFKKVILVVLENTDVKDALKQPFMGSLLKRGSFLANFSATTRPSQGNYIALTSGSTHGVKTNKNVTLNVQHIGDLLEENNRTWKMYAEDYPGKCFLGRSYRQYARKHAPFLSYKNVQDNPARCAKVVNAKKFTQDIAANALPDYSLYIPNESNNGHDTGPAGADKWLKNTFGNLISSERFMKDKIFIITFDEDKAGSKANKVYTMILGENVKPRFVSQKPYTHYSLLRMIQDNWDLDSLGKLDAMAPSIDDIWK